MKPILEIEKIKTSLLADNPTVHLSISSETDSSRMFAIHNLIQPIFANRLKRESKSVGVGEKRERFDKYLRDLSTATEGYNIQEGEDLEQQLFR